jgi:hypothetical protein
VWSLLAYVKDEDVKAAAVLPEVDGEEEDLPMDWDSIKICRVVAVYHIIYFAVTVWAQIEIPYTLEYPYPS